MRSMSKLPRRVVGFDPHNPQYWYGADIRHNMLVKHLKGIEAGKRFTYLFNGTKRGLGGKEGAELLNFLKKVFKPHSDATHFTFFLLPNGKICSGHFRGTGKQTTLLAVTKHATNQPPKTNRDWNNKQVKDFLRRRGLALKIAASPL